MSGPGALLRGVFVETLRGFDLRARVRRAVGVRGDVGPFRAIAIGKAAAPMIEGALEAGIRYERALVVLPDGASTTASVTTMFASHPIPDERSVRAAEAALALAEPDTGTLHVFVSGGASALACAPAPGVSLEHKAYVTRAMLAAGADIRELNVARRHLSRLKGGGLLRAARASRVYTAVVSDVIGGAAWEIGSGPTAVDPTTVADARRVLDRYVPELGPLPLVETLKVGAPEARTSALEIVADADAFVAALADRLRDRGLSAIASSAIALDVERTADVVIDLARGLGRQQAVVFSTEPTVRLPRGAGKGGRATHLALLVADRLPDDVVVLAGATDGVDGASETGGAVVTKQVADSMSSAERAHAIASFDAGALLVRAGAALPHGPTGLNFSDVVVIARA